jgi:hypothetical protein
MIGCDKTTQKGIVAKFSAKKIETFIKVNLSSALNSNKFIYKKLNLLILNQFFVFFLKNSGSRKNMSVFIHFPIFPGRTAKKNIPIGGDPIDKNFF